MIKLNYKSTANQVAEFFLILGFNIIFFVCFAWLTAIPLFGEENLYTAGALRYINCLTQIGIMGLTAFECAYLFNNKNAINYLQLNKGFSFSHCLLVVLIAVLSLPFLSYIIEWNEGIKLPQFMSSIEAWMQEKENDSEEITNLMLAGNSIQIMLVNLAVMAIIPAICEEFLFRGLLVTWFKNKIKNVHIVVFLSAFIFSAIHLQFYGFVPRFLLGLYLGYLFVWTGSLWVCIMVHFINNAMAVIVSYLFNNQLINTEYQQFGNVGNNYLLIGLSLLFSAVCIYFLYRKRLTVNFTDC